MDLNFSAYTQAFISYYLDLIKVYLTSSEGRMASIVTASRRQNRGAGRSRWAANPIRTRSAVFSLMVLLSVTFTATLSADAPSNAVDPPSRSFVFSYVVKVKLPASSHKMRAWIPLPITDGFQTISQLQLQVPNGVHIQKDAESGARYAYFTADPSRIKSPFEVRLTFQVVRYERRVNLTPDPGAQPALPNPVLPSDISQFLQADKWAPIDAGIERLSREQTQGLTDPLQKAHKIFEYVVSSMDPASDRVVESRADARKACDSRGTDCTGFNSTFISLARAAGIPARLEIGFAFPDGEKEGDVSGYHCWAEFYVSGIGWIPLDASGASQNLEKREDFFGAIDARRVMISTGSSDLAATHLNDLVNPYIEIDGKPCVTYSADFFFQEAEPSGPISSRRPIYARAHAPDDAQQRHFPG
jgi:hypothetical protein